ncbi:MAG: PTS sugar transporter subunit IIC, partial [Nitrospirota bacterium]|nr:PTS sugar transporter subunit IIC [Nitrospirota bacterium]
RTAVGQFMISQPIVAAPLVGLALGDVQTGLILGALLELVWISDLPVGKFVPPDSTAAAVIATGMSIIGGNAQGGVTPAIMLWSVLLALPMAWAVQKGDTVVRRLNIRFSSQAVATLHEKAVTRCHWKGIGVFFANYFVLITCFLLAGVLLLGAVGGLLPGQEMRGASLFLQCLPIVGVATWLAKDKGKRGMMLFAAGFVAAYAVGGIMGVPWVVVLSLVLAGAVAWSFYELRG